MLHVLLGRAQQAPHLLLHHAQMGQDIYIYIYGIHTYQTYIHIYIYIHIDNFLFSPDLSAMVWSHGGADYTASPISEP